MCCPGPNEVTSKIRFLIGKTPGGEKFESTVHENNVSLIAVDQAMFTS